MPILKKRRKEKAKQGKDIGILADFLGTTQDDTVDYLQKSVDPRELEHYILDRCEQMIENTKQLDVVKDEYYDVVGCLNDLQAIEDMPKPQWKELKESAAHMVRISRQQEEYLADSRKLSKEQFMRMREHEGELPDILRRMKENETYDAMVRRDMGYLEGEKNEWVEKKRKLKKEEKVLKTLSMFLLGIFITLCVILLFLQFGFGVGVKLPFLAVVCACAICGVAVFVRLQNGRRDYRAADKNLNYAVALLNKVKVKYVNTANALDYTGGKFQVKNSYELEYQWGQYREALKRQENLKKLNVELEQAKKQLGFHMNKGLLNNPDFWASRPELLLDKQEQLLFKQELYNREEKLRRSIEKSAAEIRGAKSEVERIISRRPDVAPEITEILASIDELLKKGRWS